MEKIMRNNEKHAISFTNGLTKCELIQIYETIRKRAKIISFDFGDEKDPRDIVVVLGSRNKMAMLAGILKTEYPTLDFEVFREEK
jgi:hypothetical protein